MRMQINTLATVEPSPKSVCVSVVRLVCLPFCSTECIAYVLHHQHVERSGEKAAQIRSAGS